MRETDPVESLVGPWDYVIAGAGSAWSVMAARLSEDPASRVLLLEAGPNFRSDEAPPEMRMGHWTSVLDPVRFSAYNWTALRARRFPDRDPEPYWRGRGVGDQRIRRRGVAGGGTLRYTARTLRREVETHPCPRHKSIRSNCGGSRRT